MKTVPGIYDGNNVKPTEKFEARPNTKVLITFLDEDARPSPFELTRLETSQDASARPVPPGRLTR